MLTFKDFLTVDLKPGEDEYIKYRNQKRRRGAMSSGEGGPVSEGLEDPKDNPCWDGYKPVGTKEKNGKVVPNCVPESLSVEEIINLLSEAPLSVAKSDLNSTLMNFIRDALKNGKQADLEKLAAAVGKKLTVKGNRVIIEGEEIEITDDDDTVEEALDPMQRMKKKAIMKRLKARIQLGRKRAAKKRATPEKIKARAEKRARMAIFKKLAAGQGKEDMSYSQRKSIEKRLEKKKTAIARIAKKLLPTVRKDDMAKMVAKGK